jgi:predicted Zn finger-like uncharacterized protein
MQATCPHCGTTYNLTPRQLGPAGRTLQCAKCRHKWFVAPPAPEPAPATAGAAPADDDVPPLPPSALPGLDELASIGGRPRWWRQLQLHGGPELSLTLAALLAGALALGAFSWLLRNNPDPAPATPAAVITHQPGPQPAGLALSGIRRDLTARGTDTLLTIKGSVANQTATSQALPELRVQLLDRNGIELDYWPATYTSPTLPPDAATAWQATFINPPLARVAAYRAFFTAPLVSLPTPTRP